MILQNVLSPRWYFLGHFLSNLKYSILSYQVYFYTGLCQDANTDILLEEVKL